MLNIEIDEASAVPPYAQLREAILGKITNGELALGAKLLPVRTLAAELGLAANTVARSYRELEAAGFVETRGRNGTVVAPRLSDPERRIRALELSREYVSSMTALGIDRAEVADYLGRV